MNTFKDKINLFVKDNKFFIVFFILTFIIFSLWLIGYNPGIMTPDSIDQWMQAYRFDFSNHHPFFHTFLISLAQRIIYGPAFIALIQILIASLIPSFLLNYLIKKGLNKYIATILLLFYVSSPSIGVFNITLWKDILFSLGIFGLCTFFIMHYIDGFNRKKLSSFIFIALIILVSTLRHNGVLFVLLIPVLYFLFNIFTLKKSIVLLTITGIGFLLIQFPLSTLLNVYKPNFINSVTFIHIVAGSIYEGYELNDTEKEVIEKLIPVESIMEKYDCRNGNSLYFSNPDFNPSVLDDPLYKSQFDQLAIGIIQRSLPLVLANRTCMFTNMVGLNANVFLYGEKGIADEIVEGYEVSQHQSNLLTPQFDRVIRYTTNNTIPTLLYWNISIYILLTMMVVIIRRDKLSLGYLIVSLFNLLPLFAGGVGGDYRFVYSIHITGIFAIAILFLPRRNIKREVLKWVKIK